MTNTKTKKQEFTIWGSDIQLWKEEVFNGWKEDYFYIFEKEGAEDEIRDYAHEMNSEYLEFARYDLNIKLNQPIIIIADLGLWNGRIKGHKIIKSGNIKDCLSCSEDEARWYVDSRGNLRCTAHHHDGTNHYLYRVFKDNVSEAQIENFCYKICKGRLQSADITRYTKRLGGYIGEVYGWKF